MTDTIHFYASIVLILFFLSDIQSDMDVEMPGQTGDCIDLDQFHSQVSYGLTIAFFELCLITTQPYCHVFRERVWVYRGRRPNTRTLTIP